MSMTKEAIQKICHDTGLYHQPALNEKLYLHRQGFKKIENLDEYTEVRALWLGGNGIRRLENLHPLSKLKCLYLEQNELTRIENLHCCPELVILDLSQNNISRIEGLSGLSRLSSFKIAHNKIASLVDILELQRCPSLTNVDISYNNLSLSEEHPSDFDLQKESYLAPACGATADLPASEAIVGIVEGSSQIEKIPAQQALAARLMDPENSTQNSCTPIVVTPSSRLTGTPVEHFCSTTNTAASSEFVECLKTLPSLSSLYLMGNPIIKQVMQYRRTMIANLPTLRYLDDRPVKEEDREAAIAWFRGGWEEEKKVILAHRQREQDILRGRVSTLRSMQESHRLKIKLALRRISSEACGKATGKLAPVAYEPWMGLLIIST
ncbi:leucine rich repeat-containing protein [Cyclospora cayetanensis]|uniref:Leucine rich repeat-containing protein n=1 Tax=Cyclospora cayetanensis TaxID=88456 RepID=A0A1D3D5A2_9EIME|nr:leucine rich repeat-containing protein [Cyclospora cayetanensis]